MWCVRPRAPTARAVRGYTYLPCTALRGAGAQVLATVSGHHDPLARQRCGAMLLEVSNYHQLVACFNFGFAASL